MVYPFLEFQPDGGWVTFQAAGVSGIPTEPFIPDTGAAVHVKLYDGADAVDGVAAGAGTDELIEAPAAGGAAGGVAGGGVTAVLAAADGGADWLQNPTLIPFDVPRHSPTLLFAIPQFFAPFAAKFPPIAEHSPDVYRRIFCPPLCVTLLIPGAPVGHFGL